MSDTTFGNAPRVTHAAGVKSALPSALRTGWARAVATLHLWRQRARERRELRRALHIHAALGGERALYDLGALPAELRWEARKPFWRG